MHKAIFWDLQGTHGGDAGASLEAFQPYPFSIAAPETVHYILSRKDEYDHEI